MVINYDEKLNFWLRKEETREIEEALKKRPDLYSSKSHFIRAAIIKEIKRNKDVDV